MMIAMMIEDMLADMGHQVVGVAPNLQTGLALAEAHPCDVAILDINLGSERSFPIAHLLRERGTPFIFATGYGTLGLEEPFQGAFTLKKPFKQEDLAYAIETVTG